MAKRVGPWHDWFAWHPVHTDYYGWRWLRTMRRRRIVSGYRVSGYFVAMGAYWDYALPGDEW